MMLRIATALLVLAMPARATPPAPAALAEVDHIFAAWQVAAHIPGLVYGVVADGRLVAVHGFGVQDTVTNRAVTADSLFRIASMSKAFTALAVLNLRDGGRLAIDAKQCAQMKAQMKAGMKMTPAMQPMMDHCDKIDRGMGATKATDDTLSR